MQIQIQNNENQFCRIDPHEEANLLKVVVEVGQVLARQDSLRASWTLKLHFELLILKFLLFFLLYFSHMHSSIVDNGCSVEVPDIVGANPLDL